GLTGGMINVGGSGLMNGSKYERVPRSASVFFSPGSPAAGLSPDCSSASEPPAPGPSPDDSSAPEPPAPGPSPDDSSAPQPPAPGPSPDDSSVSGRSATGPSFSAV